MASLRTAYVLWFFGGILGLHHLYLNRPRQCFIWFVTWGGMVLGWLAEVTQMQVYVDEANQTKEYRDRMKVMKRHLPKPGLNIMLLGSQLMIGHQLGKLFICAVPQYYTVEPWFAPYLSHFLSALGSSIGVYVASNVGSQQAPFLLPFLASVATIPTSYYLYNRRTIYTMLCVIVASLVSGQLSTWTTRKRPSTLVGHLKVIGFLGLAIGTYGMLWTSNMYFNTTVNTLNGTKIPLKDAIFNFAKTQPWDDARDVVNDVIPCLRMYTLETCQHEALSRLAELADPERDAWSFSVLGFEKYPDQKEVVTRCRKLSSKWHPDRFAKKNDTLKDEAEKKFLDIQKACGMMNKIKMNRERKNTWATSAADQTETIITNTDDVNTINDDEMTDNDDVSDYSDDDEDEDYADDEDEIEHSNDGISEQFENSNVDQKVEYCDASTGCNNT